MVAQTSSLFPRTGTEARRDRARIGCIVAGIAQVILSWGLYTRADWATRVWPWPDVKMSFIFLAAIGLAIGVPLLWIGLTGEIGALEPLFLLLGVGLGGIGSYLLVRSWGPQDIRLATYGGIAVSGGAGFLLLYRWSRSFPLLDTRPLAPLLRLIFLVFCGILTVAGVALLFQVERVFPWNLQPGTSTLFGWIFIGAAILFAWIVAHPKWGYGAGALIGFLAYDLLLYLPYVDLWRSRHDSTVVSSYYGGATSADLVNEKSLVIYLSVLVVSGLVAVIALPLYRFRRVSTQR